MSPPPSPTRLELPPRGPPEPSPFELRRAHLEELELPLVRPFTTSFGTERRRRVLLLALEERGGEVGHGECVAGRVPLYSPESVGTVLHLLRTYHLPALRTLPEASPQRFLAATGRIRGHPMAKATVEMALWDLAARLQGRPLGRLLCSRGELRTRIEVGVSVGLQRSPPALVKQVEGYRGDGYGRIKLKVEPGRDLGFVRAVRRALPGVPLWIDANQAYDARSWARVARMAREGRLGLVEQPFPEDALLLHARLARALPPGCRVCLDVSIASVARFDTAAELGAVGAVNIKPGRMGGHATSVALHDRAVRRGVPVWCGGMLETGIGRAHALHLASLPNFRLPADLSASDRYWREEILPEPFRLGPGSTLGVPRGPGIGVAPEERTVRRYRVHRRTVRLRERI